MSTVRKLTDSDKQEILKLYRESAETTSTLAERYGVSNSTISRLLKSTLPEEEYEYLVSLKRAARTPEGRAQVSYDQLPLLNQPLLLVEASTGLSSGEELPTPEAEKLIIAAKVDGSPDFPEDIPVDRRVKTRPSAGEQPQPPVIKESPVVKELEIIKHKPTETPIPKPKLGVETRHSRPSLFAEILDEDLLDQPDDLDDDDDRRGRRRSPFEVEEQLYEIEFNKEMEEGETEEGNAFTGMLKKTKKGDSFELGGKNYTDRSNLEEKWNKDVDVKHTGEYSDMSIEELNAAIKKQKAKIQKKLSL